MLCSFYFARAAQIPHTAVAAGTEEEAAAMQVLGLGLEGPGRWRGAGVGPARNLAALHSQTAGRLYRPPEKRGPRGLRWPWRGRQ